VSLLIPQRVITALLFAALPTLSWAGQAQVPQREADKAEGIKRIMAERTFEMSRVVRKQDKAFCQSFLQDFGHQEHIEFIEPVARADTYDDPVWAPYRGRCPGVPIFDDYECEPKIYDAIMAQPPEVRQREFKSVCRHYRGTAGFKLFRVDINNNPKDGKEHVFYYERAQGPLNRPDAKLNYRNGGYSVIDLDRCELRGGAEAHDPYSYFYQRPMENYSGMIKYKDGHYIFDLFELEGADRKPSNLYYVLHLNGYSRFGRDIKPRLGPICDYSTPVLKSK
jgi:hypothetical protein